MTIAEKLRFLRTSKGISQYRLAKLSGVSQPGINKIENGLRNNPSADTLSKLAKALDVQISEFYSDDELCLKEPEAPYMLAKNMNVASILSEAEKMDLSPEEKEALELYKKMPPEEQQKELFETVIELLLDLPAKDREVIMNMIKAYALSLR